MTTEKKRAAIAHAEAMAAHWLALGNQALENGNPDLAQRHFERSGKQLDKANRLRGYGDGTDI